MIERAHRIMGWVIVVLGASVPFISIGRHHQGLTIPWWEPFVFAGAALSTILVGFALALPNPGPRFTLVALSTWGVLLVAFGVVALLLPAEVLVRRGRGPRTVVMAQVRGVFMLVAGSALIWWAAVLAVRRRKGRTRARDAASR